MTELDELRKRIDFLDIAFEAAELAAEVHHTYDYDDVRLKARQQLVTEADVAAERAIKEHIADHFPNHAFVGEEEGAEGNSSHVWHIDPIDGTTDFVYGLPHSSTSIALVVDGTREIGVVGHPNSGTTYAAVRDEGAFQNNDRITVSTESNPNRSLFAIGFSHRDAGNKQILETLEYLIQETLGVRRYGSSALNLCYVADGTLDGFIHRNLGTWDVAAGSLIAEEAGGVVQNFKGEAGDDAVLDGDIIATNESLCEQLPFVG